MTSERLEFTGHHGTQLAARLDNPDGHSCSCFNGALLHLL